MPLTDPAYRLWPLTPPALDALARGDLAAASATTGVALTPFIADERWLWEIRSVQVAADPASAAWVARPAQALTGPDAGEIVGHIGFHAAPDERGMVEVGYSVDPARRRRGHARAMLEQELDRMRSDPAVRVVRASISPDNVASLGTIAGLGFVEVGLQVDEEDGPEVLWELEV